MVYVLLMLITSLRASISNMFFFALSVSVAFNIISNTDYFTERANLSLESNNTTALVYLQGVDYAEKALTNTNGMGLGFQMMGTQKSSEVTDKLISLVGSGDGGGVNRLDGGFLAAKIITEFGVLGIGLLLIYLFSFCKSLLYLRYITRYGIGKENVYLSISHSIFCTFIVEIFVRGVGYFSPGVVIFLVSYFLRFTHKHHQRSTNGSSLGTS